MDAAERFAVDEPLDLEVLLPAGRSCHTHARFDTAVEPGRSHSAGLGKQRTGSTKNRRSRVVFRWVPQGGRARPVAKW